MCAMDDAAFEQTALAGAASAIAAAIGQTDTIADRRAQQGFVGQD